MSIKLTFSGHESFQCRQLWLKKGYDFIKQGRKFTEEDAVVELGVGKNMVAGISFWMKAFGMLDKDGELTEFADYILDSDEGKDPYFEDEATLWLLHYQLVTQNIASTYNLIFNEYRREKIEFTKDNFIAFVLRKAEELNISQINKNTVATDFEVLTKMYIRTDSVAKPYCPAIKKAALLLLTIFYLSELLHQSVIHQNRIFYVLIKQFLVF